MTEMSTTAGSMEKSREAKQRYEGVYLPTGETIRFNQKFKGHTFTEEECKALLRGEKISGTYVTRDGRYFTAKGRLREQTFNGHHFWGMQLDPYIPEYFNGHAFSEEEKMELMQGSTLHLSDCVSKRTGKTFEAEVRYGMLTEGEDAGKYRVVASFMDGYDTMKAGIDYSA